MSKLGQNRISSLRGYVFCFAPRADIAHCSRHVCFVPNPEVPTALDDLVGVAHLRKRHRQSQRSGGIEIDEQLNSGRLVNWQSTGLAPSFVFEIRLTEWCELAGRQARRLIF
jgi:hypothetical protein